MPITFINTCPHAMRFRPASDKENDATPHETDIVVEPMDKKFEMTFRAAQHPSTPCDFELVLESGEQVPLYYPGEFFFKVPVEGAFPDIPDGAVILASMVTANAMKMGGDRIDPANLKLWFKAEGIRVVCPCTFGPNCIRDAKGNIFATRAFEVASGW